MQIRIKINNQVEYKSSSFVKLLLRSMVIPSSVFMWRTRLQMAPYVPSIRQCYTCGQLNHATKFCKNLAKCLRCGKDLHPEQQQCDIKPNCINCNDEHHTLAKEYPEIIVKKKAMELIALRISITIWQRRR